MLAGKTNLDGCKEMKESCEKKKIGQLFFVIPQATALSVVGPWQMFEIRMYKNLSVDEMKGRLETSNQPWQGAYLLIIIK